MGDPISAGVVGSVVAPSLGAGTVTSALGAGLGAGSLFGFDPTIGGVGQGILEGLSGANTWMNKNPMTSQIGLSLAKNLMQSPAPMPMPGAAPIQRGQVQPMDYMSLLNPQQQNVLRPAPISLL